MSGDGLAEYWTLGLHEDQRSKLNKIETNNTSLSRQNSITLQQRLVGRVLI